MSSKEAEKYGLMTVKLMAAERPVFLEKQNKDWIYFGKNNDYPNYLIELKRRSPLHSTIIDKKVRLISGAGWKVDTKGLSVTEGSILSDWINNPNGMEDLNEVTKKITYDLETFDGVYVQVIYDKGQSKKKKLVHVPFEYVRRNKECNEFYYTKHWFKTDQNGNRKANPNPQEAEDYQVFKPYDESKKGDKSQIYFYDCYSIGKDVYPLPNYLAGITAIETEARIDNFWLNFIKKGFSVSKKINFYNGIPTPEDQRKIKQQINEQLTGDDGDTVLISFSNDKDHGSEVEDLAPSDFDKQYQELKQTTQTTILQIHGISNPTMLGIKTPGQLGNRDELIDAVEEFQNLYITPRQNIIEHIFNELLAEEGFEGRMKLNQLEPLGMRFSEALISSVIPQSALADMVATKLGIDLKKYAGQPISTTISKSNNNFSASESKVDEIILSLFSKLGIEKKNCKVKESRDFEFTTDEDLDASETLFSQKFEDELKTTGLPAGSINIPPIKTPKIETMVVYSYEGPEDSSNRAFCSKMLSLNRYYTKADMRAIDSEIRSNDEYSSAFGDLDINVWKHRGGWYRKSGTDVSLPQCRHRWVQSLILKES